MDDLDVELRAVELGVNADEERQGIDTITALRFKEMTIIVVETTDAIMAGGIYVSNNETYARGRAREIAIARAANLRLSRRNKFKEAAE